MTGATVLSMLLLLLLVLLATVQAEDAPSNATDCEAAKESVERSFQILSISTRQLGQKCREEKRECDKKIREAAKVEEAKTQCESKIADLDDQISNYATSFDELGMELHKCKEESETAGSGCGGMLPENATTTEELDQLKAEKDALQTELDQERERKESLEAELRSEKEEIEKLRDELSQAREENGSLMKQLDEEKQNGVNQQDELEAARKERDETKTQLEEEKEARGKLEEEVKAMAANYSGVQRELAESRNKFSLLEKQMAHLETKLQRCNELRSETPPETLNEVDNKNTTEKCSRIGRDIDLVRTNAGIYYFNYNSALPWWSANDYCRSRGLEMATAETADELLEVGRVRSRGYHVAFWTSASDRGHRPGQFHWANGRKVATDLWFPGQPDQAAAGREDCAYVFGTRLKDSPCSNSFYFACQVPMECVPHLR